MDLSKGIAHIQCTPTLLELVEGIYSTVRNTPSPVAEDTLKWKHTGIQTIGFFIVATRYYFISDDIYRKGTAVLQNRIFSSSRVELIIS